MVQTASDASGVLVIDKPSGLTSHDVVACVRRATGWAKAGHTGTLDPLATGVLPLVVGRATRLARFFSATDKEYQADIRLGWTTDTYDAEGRRIDTGLKRSAATEVDPASGRSSASGWPGLETIHRALSAFLGEHDQLPPPFSAKKIQGVRAYALARQGQQVEPKSARVTLHEVSVLSFADDALRVSIRCSAGFYVRSFAHALGEALGTGAHVASLRRTRCGDYDGAGAISLDAIQKTPEQAWLALVPIDRLLCDLPLVVVTAQGAERARHGNDLRPGDCLHPAAGTTGRVRIADEQGVLLAVGEVSASSGLLHPEVVVG